MYDCPACRVPLHGFEEVCPSCGTKQKVRISEGGGSKRGSSLFAGQQKAKGPNYMPVLVIIVIGGILVFFLAQSSWVGQVMRRGPAEVDPLEKITPMQARKMVASKINESLASIGAKGTVTWTQHGGGGGPADINFNGPVEITVETELQDPQLRFKIMDPIKDLMYKAQVLSMVVKDTKKNATWTRNVSMPATSSQSGESAAPSAQE
ncbi:MAG: hypothetical protein KIT34_06870 [Cyanobacteria bacterium TGS_CYA1]|nr:hypothetical protein [Cyanobacteria bacterium TGS_CYA1]